MTSRAQNALDTIFKGNPSVFHAFIVRASGHVESWPPSQGQLVQAATALVTPLRELIDRTVLELDGGRFKTALVEGEDASLAVADIDGENAVMLVARPQTPLGSLLEDARWAANQMAGIS